MQKASLIFFALLALTLMTSCGPMPKKGMQGQSIDSALTQYLEQFESQASSHGVNVDASSLTMTFSESMPPSSIQGASVLAYCQRTFQGQNVVVKGSAFNSMSVSDREQLVFHELGHCLLGLEHDNGTETAFDYYGLGSYATGVPSSIMNQLHFASFLYNGNRATYLDRLFKHANNVPLYWNAPSQFDTKMYE